MISAVGSRSGTGPLKRWKLASCISTATNVPAAALRRPRSSFRGAGRVENLFCELHQRGVQRTRVLANVGVGAGLAEQDRAEHLPVMTGEADSVRQPHQRAGHVPRDGDPGDAGRGMHGESLDKQRAQKVHLAREVVEEQPLGHGSSMSDGGCGGRVEAVCREEVLCRVKNPFARVTAAHNLAIARRGVGVRRAIPRAEGAIENKGAGPPGTFGLGRLRALR